MRRFLAENSLSVFFFVIWLASLVGQAFVGAADYNMQRTVDGLEPTSVWNFVTSSQYAVDVTENWQSEYLQFLLFIWVTVYFIQKGSPESKEPGKEGKGSDEEQKVGAYVEDDSPHWAKTGGLRTQLYSRSLGLLMATIFLLSWAAQFVTGWSAYNSNRLEDLQAPVSLGTYFGQPDFWNRSLQNWQSEFLAVFSMAVFSIYLRHRGSPESKPVGEAHGRTGVTA